jgi:hypothetical protein
MVPERQYHANGRTRSAVPGTPSRKDKHRESSALQDPGLKDYVRIYPSEYKNRSTYTRQNCTSVSSPSYRNVYKSANMGFFLWGL